MKDIRTMTLTELRTYRLKLKADIDFWRKIIREENIDTDGLRYKQALKRVRQTNEEGTKIGNQIKQLENAKSTENS